MANRALVNAAVLLALASVGCGGTEDRQEPRVSVASALTNVHVLQDVSTLFCLDSNASGTAYALGCNDGNFQNWSMQTINSLGWLQLVDAQTRRCLQSNPAGNVSAQLCTGGNFQHWVMSSNGTSVYFRDVATGFCLDSDTSGKLSTLPCNGGASQSWIIR